MWAILYLTGLLRLFFADAASFFFRAKNRQMQVESLSMTDNRKKSLNRFRLFKYQLRLMYELKLTSVSFEIRLQELFSCTC
jgi:hypothetical protein